MTFPTPILLSRRTALLGAAAAPLAGAALTNVSLADGHAPKGPSIGPAEAFKLGSAEVVALLDGTRVVDGDPQGTFAMNVDQARFAEVSAEAFLPIDKTRFFFTPTLVKIGGEAILFDTGLGGENGNIVAALADAGHKPEDITVVVLTHMHPDHIGGLMGGNPFPNARFVMGAKEYDFWAGPGANNRVGEMVAKGVTPLAEKATMIEPGQDVVTGVQAVEAFGHTPGHMAYRIESDGQNLLIAADTANHYVWSLAYPEWEVRFDADKAAAAATRKRLFGMVAAEKMPFLGYHMPFPALGYVETRGDGFRYVPHSYQLQL